MHYLGLLYKMLHMGWVIKAEIYSLAIPAAKLKVLQGHAPSRTVGRAFTVLLSGSPGSWHSQIVTAPLFPHLSSPHAPPPSYNYIRLTSTLCQYDLILSDNICRNSTSEYSLIMSYFEFGLGSFTAEDWTQCLESSKLCSVIQPPRDSNLEPSRWTKSRPKSMWPNNK